MHTEPLPRFRKWLAEADREMKTHWAIDTADAGYSRDELRTIWRSGERAADFVARHASKYGLLTKEEWDPFGVFRSDQ